jgi:biopolymer transport protein ExbB/TolQ
LFFVVIIQGPFSMPLMTRYFAGHPVSYVATAMFFVGMASLLMKLHEVWNRQRNSPEVKLPPSPEEGQHVSAVSDLLDDIEDLPQRSRESYLGRRLREALEYVERNGSADDLNDQLKYLAETDANRQHESYSLARIIIWATPMLGFLGTVIGITRALGNLDSTAMAESMQTAMNDLLGGLYVAFDTTALALTLSIVLMFVQFLIERFETAVLSDADEAADRALIGRFQATGSQDPDIVAIRGMTQEVVQGTENLVGQQIELWQATIDAAHHQWSALVGSTGAQIEESMAAAVATSIDELGGKISEAVTANSRLAKENFNDWSKAFAENSQVMQLQQQQMVKQGELMTQVVAATGDVVKLETALNQNLRGLAGAKNFEDTVMSLAAAIHLLNTRLSADAGNPVNLGREADDQAA